MIAADREIRLGLWKIHILHHAASRPVWGLWLLDELAEHGHRLSPGTLYPALARMTKHGWLAQSAGARHSNARRVLRITPSGRQLLKALRADVAELHAEVVLGRETRLTKSASPRQVRARSKTDRARGPKSTAPNLPRSHRSTT